MVNNPKSIDNLVYNDDDSVPTILNTVTGQLFVTNAVGKRVIELCDGTRSLDDIASQLSREFSGCAPQVIRTDIDEFVRQSVQQGLTR